VKHARGPRKRVGEALVRAGALSREQLTGALDEQRLTGRKLGEVLVDQGLVSPDVVVRIVADHLGVKGCVLRHGLIDPVLLDLIGPKEAGRMKALPMFLVRDTLTVAMAEPQSLPNTDQLRLLTGYKIRPILALEANVLDFIEKYAAGETDMSAFLASLAQMDVSVIEHEKVDERPVADLDKMDQGSPVIDLVNMLLLTSVRDGASDIHIEPEKKGGQRGTRIRYRIDGRLRDLMKPPTGLHAAITSRVKVIGKMNIAEKRLPQEGRVRVVADKREIDLRVSSMPTLLGEKVVLRILDKANLHRRMEDLGFRTDTLEAFRKMLREPNGLVLVTGPTGSGKTTTLYSALDVIRNPELNILTVEDPVEYQLDLINQVQVQARIGMTFARILRSMLRQDPDVIMVGEIRDEETARVAVQAALTGHLVLATLHTNDAPGAVARLLDMGIEPYLLSGALNGVVAQRLARLVCNDCGAPYTPAENVLEDAGLTTADGYTFRRGEGCSECHESGFRGRSGIYEVMEITPEVRRMIHRAAPTHELRGTLRRSGFLTLREEGVLMAGQGRTTLEEALSVTHGEAEPPPDDVA